MVFTKEHERWMQANNRVTPDGWMCLGGDTHASFEKEEGVLSPMDFISGVNRPRIMSASL
jgi:hypothetical protein